MNRYSKTRLNKLCLLLTAGALCLFCVGCGSDTATTEEPPGASVPDLAIMGFDASNAMEEVRQFIQIAPRHTGSAGMLMATLHLEGKLKQWGYDPTVDTFETETPGGPLIVRNVYATLQGKSRKTLILGGHTDTKSGISHDFGGANDSGSSTGVLLELARHLAQNKEKPTFTIMFAFFDGEECRHKYGPRDGLHGSRQLARTLKREGKINDIIGVVVIDMIGDKDLLAKITDNAGGSLPRSTRTAARKLTGATLQAARKLGYSKFIRSTPATIIDDHRPFLDAGIPAIDIIDFKFGSGEGRNNYWHTTEDTIDKLSVRSLKIIGQTLLQLITNLHRETR